MKCKNCFYKVMVRNDSSEPHINQCKRFPPTPLLINRAHPIDPSQMITQQVQLYPTVADDDTCGEFQLPLKN